MPRVNDEWSAGVNCGEPGYRKAATLLLWRWVASLPADLIPPNVLLAMGYLCGVAMHDEADDKDNPHIG